MAKKKSKTANKHGMEFYKLNAKDEAEFQKWYKDNYKRLGEPKDPSDSNIGYDWRGTWNAEGKPKVKSFDKAKPSSPKLIKKSDAVTPVKKIKSARKTIKSLDKAPAEEVEGKAIGRESKKLVPKKKSGTAKKTPKKEVVAEVETKVKEDTGMSKIQALYLAGGILDATSQAIGSMAKASAIRSRGKFESAAYMENAKRMGLAADDAIKRGNKEAGRHMKSVRKLMGSQRAALAASGVELESGSARDLQLETIELGQEDASTIRTNAFMEAHGYKQQAVELEHQAQLTRIGSKARQKATLLSGRLGVVKTAVNTGISMNKAGSAKNAKST